MRLISRLFVSPSAVPDGELVFAVGDIHGRDDLLGLLHQTIETELAAAEAERAQVIYLGDYVDRGPQSKAVVDRLLDRPVKGAESVFLMGNHEDSLLQFLSGQDDAGRWLTLGGGATAMSYGVSLRNACGKVLSLVEIRRELTAAIPAHHVAFFRRLQLSHRVGDYLFVHAGIKPKRPLDQQDPQDMLWIRRDFLRSRRRHGAVIVHGHSSVSEVVVRRNRICVDTMAYATDRLSCLVLRGEERRILTAQL